MCRKGLPFIKKNIWLDPHLVVFIHDRGKGYHWDGLVMIWDTSYCPELYDVYLGDIYGFCSADAIYGNWTVTDLTLLDVFFLGLCIWTSYNLL